MTSPVQVKPMPIEKMLAGVPQKVRELPLKSFNKGIFGKELVDLGIADGGNITEGTYGGTQLALTEIYDRVESG